MRRASPIVWKVSMKKTIKKWEKIGFLEDLKKHILDERKRVPNWGTQNAKIIHHIHATRSADGNLTINCFSRPENY